MVSNHWWPQACNGDVAAASNSIAVFVAATGTYRLAVAAVEKRDRASEQTPEIAVGVAIADRTARSSPAVAGHQIG